MSPVIGMLVEPDDTNLRQKEGLIRWVKHHSIAASLFPFGLTELISKTGVLQIMLDRKFWQEWIFQQLILPDLNSNGALSLLSDLSRQIVEMLP